MKKILLITLILIISFLFAACNQNDAKSNASNNNQSQIIQQETSQPKTVVVPNVVGMDKENAVKTLEDLGLKTDIEIKRLVLKGINTFETYPDNYILEQSHSEGTVVIEKTTIKIVLHKKETWFEYEINADNTITLNELVKRQHGVDEIVFPTEYDGYIVSAINAEVIDEASLNRNVVIPKNIKIIGTPQCSYELR